MNTCLEIMTFDTYICYIQKQFALNIYLQMKELNFVAALILFIAGIVTSLNPCMLSIIPLSISYLTSTSSNNYNKLYFFLGLLTSFLLFFFFSITLNKKYFIVSHVFPILSYLAITIIGLNLLQIINSPIWLINLSILPSQYIQNNMRNYIIGITLGCSSFPCSTSLLVTISLWLSYASDYITSIMYIAIYLFGTISPILLLINLTFSYIRLLNISLILSNIVMISGCFFVGTGIFFLLGTMFI